jgi:hypothetical protein
VKAAEENDKTVPTAHTKSLTGGATNSDPRRPGRICRNITDLAGLALGVDSVSVKPDLDFPVLRNTPALSARPELAQ